MALAPDNSLFVADTFNGVIRKIDPKTKKVETWLGTGKSSPGEETAEKIGFSEPGGLTLFIADTNHHRIVAVDLKTKQPRVLKIQIDGR